MSRVVSAYPFVTIPNMENLFEDNASDMKHEVDETISKQVTNSKKRGNAVFSSRSDM